ncbi:aromatic ring-hydroxylating dioxygenase subunit alpha [Sphingopyxis panaciterrulae]
MTRELQSPYLFDCWYVAAWANELRPGEHMRRVLLDRSVLLMRGLKGDTAAIGNVCPHRFASLSEGRFERDLVECPYHGLRFDMSGQCVHNPHGDGRITERARVASYPLVERHGALWIWLGDIMAADPARIPDLCLLETTDPTDRAPGYLLTKANYQLLSDNILDLSHADFIHPATLGTGGEIAGTKARARLEGDIVTVEWAFTGKGMAMERSLRDGAEVDSRFEVTWYPAGVMILRNDVGPVGEGEPAAKRAGVHIMTPETSRTTHYFFENADAGRRKKLALALDVFEREDGVVLEEVQRNMGDSDFWDMEPLILSSDSGAILARRVLQRLIRRERARSATASHPPQKARLSQPF